MNRHTVYVTPSALREIKVLPGHVRQRVKRAIDDLAGDPRPSNSKVLDVSRAETPPIVDWEVRRLRIDKWRVLYVITEAENTIDVLAVRKRPPYDYGDLNQLLQESD